MAALSSSETRHDVEEAWDLGVVAYLVKPIQFEQLVEIMDHLTSLYLQFVVLPDVSED